jgi:lysophospholipase L1-like esterase
VAQSRRTAAAVVSLVAAATVPVFESVRPSVAATIGDAKPIVVMPLGDSLTDGYNIPGGYRIELVSRLDGDDLDVDLVGTLRNGPSSLRDRDHEGHSGFRIDEIAESVDRWLTRYEPDIVLLLIGTNDMVQDHQLDTAPERLGELVDQITETLPATHVIVGSIPQIVGGPYDERVVAFNDEVPDVVGERIEAGAPVSYVDINAVIDRGDLHTDYTHLNATGYCKVADVWFRAIRSVLGHGPPPSSMPATSPESTEPTSCTDRRGSS